VRLGGQGRVREATWKGMTPGRAVAALRRLAASTCVIRLSLPVRGGDLLDRRGQVRRVGRVARQQRGIVTACNYLDLCGTLADEGVRPSVWLERGSAMHATVGDKVHIKGRNVGMQEHVGEVLEVRGPEGEPPYLVRFLDGRESLVYPGPDCVIEQRGPAD
jgi:hypothetical protein